MCRPSGVPPGPETPNADGEDDHRLNYSDEHDGNLRLSVHLVGTALEAAEEERREGDAARIQVSEQGDGDAVEAIARRKLVQESVVDAEHFHRARQTR